MKKIVISAIALCCFSMSPQVSNAAMSAMAVQDTFTWTNSLNTEVAPGGSFLFSFDTTDKLAIGTVSDAQLTMVLSASDQHLGSDQHSLVTFADGDFADSVTFGGQNFSYTTSSFSLQNGLNDDGWLQISVVAPETTWVTVPLPSPYPAFTITINSTPFTVNSATLQATGSPVPVPGAAWILGSGLIGLLGIKRKTRETN